MAKRSPILGYNHNVRYRGLIFHVQTEDSGLLSPHLFTHLFHGGTIISTRKLVYDAGSAEEAIKALMQAQHKAVLKDLKRGTFDDKIDQYLGDTEGLLPRGTADTGEPIGRDSEPVMTPGAPRHARLQTDPEPDLMAMEAAPPEPEPPPEPPPVITRSRASTPPPIPPQARVQTLERKSAPSAVRTMAPPPAPQDLDPPTLNDDPFAVEAAANATMKTATPTGVDSQLDLGALDEDLHLGRRSARDTDISLGEAGRASTLSDGVPGAIGHAPSEPIGRPADSAPFVPSPEKRTGERGSAVGAASLPAARPIVRPPSRPAISAPTVVSRPLPGDEGRQHRESDAIEVYAPAPPSVEPPPGAVSERPGQYAQHKRVTTTRIPVDVIKSDRGSGSVPIPAGLARPGRPSVPSTGTLPRGEAAMPTSASRPVAHEASRPVAHEQSRPPTQEPSRPPTQEPSRPPTQEPSRPPTQEPSRPLAPSAELQSRPAQRPRTSTPARISPSGPPPSRTGSAPSGGVVMTRPAVIVGAPAKPAAPPRVRKAREEEGRGFGQGLISEKSLDEVILAYLSEDADDK